MMVAVAVAYSPPPQHSPMFGHLASSHTYAKKPDTGVFKCTRIDTRLLDLTYQVFFYIHVEIFW